MILYYFHQEEAEFATKKLADVMVEMHRSQEFQTRPHVSPIKKHDNHKQPSSHQNQHHHTRHSPRSKKTNTLATSVSFEEEDEEDEDEYSNDDFEEESILNSSRYSQSQSPAKQVTYFRK